MKLGAKILLICSLASTISEGAVINVTYWALPSQRFADEPPRQMTFDSEQGSLVSGWVWSELPTGEPGILRFHGLYPTSKTPSDQSMNSISFAVGTQQLGIPVQVGTFDNAMRAGSASEGHPGLDFTGFGGLSSLTGSFIIHTLDYNYTVEGGHNVRSMQASFFVDETYSHPAFRGDFGFNLPAIPEPNPAGAFLVLLVGLVFTRRRIVSKFAARH